jgi:hypothetical protein
MKLDPEKFNTDESRSNPMVIAQHYDDCPINSICVFMVMGSGQTAEQCKYFKDEPDSAVCNYNPSGASPE